MKHMERSHTVDLDLFVIKLKARLVSVERNLFLSKIPGSITITFDLQNYFPRTGQDFHLTKFNLIASQLLH